MGAAPRSGPRAVPTARQPKQQRSADTQRKIRDATLRCLGEVGYHRLTLARVSEIAGVSKGALFLHYPTKDCLVAAAVENYYEQLAAEYPSIAEKTQAAPPEVRFRAAIQAYWDLASRPEHRGVNEVYSAVRTDPSLAAALAPIAATAAPATGATVVALLGDVGIPEEDLAKFGVIAMFAIESAIRDGHAAGNPRANESVIDDLDEIAQTFWRKKREPRE